MSEVSPWVDGLTIGQALRETARRHGGRPALVFPQFDYRRSYAQFDVEVDEVARALLGLGIGKGEQVALWATNWPQWVLLQFATARIGAVLVTVNPAYRAHELAYVVRQSDSAALFLIDKYRTSDYFAMVNEAVPELAGAERSRLQCKDYPHLRHVVSLTEAPPVGILGWRRFLELSRDVSAAQL